MPAVHRFPSPTPLLLAVVLATGCGESTTSPEPVGSPAAVEVWRGDGQTAQVTRELPTLLAAQVLDGNGQPVPDVSVSWSVDGEGGTVEPEASATNTSGVVRARWTLGTRSGGFQAVATVSGAGSATFTATARAGPSAALHVVSGMDQVTTSGSPFSAPVVARISDEYDNPVADRMVAVTVEEGGGWVVDAFPRTDDEGLAEVDWYAGIEPGVPQRITLEVGALEAEVAGEARAPEPGASYFGHREWVEYIPGTLPFVITAPHGGTLRPDDVADRTWGVFVRDLNTDEIAYLLADALKQRTGARPHLVLLHLHRTKLDANRDLLEAAQGDPLAERAWYEFHHWTETALLTVTEHFGEGFYMDLHGHGHDLQVLELGYLLTSSDLSRPDEDLDQHWAITKSSMRTLADRTGLPFSELIRGPQSLGTLYEAEGYPSIPSADMHHPPEGAPFFSGGNNTRRHGCREGGPICGYQLELNRQGVRNTAEEWRAFAEAHARVMDTFFQAHYGIDLSAVGTSPAGVP